MKTPPAATPMIWLRSWIYLVLFLAWTLVCVLVFAPALLRPRWTHTVNTWWVRGVMVLARVVINVTFRAEGLENLPLGPCIVAAQHQSSFETYRLCMELAYVVFVLKRELIAIPFVGWYLWRAGLVPIDRASGPKAMRKTLREAQKALDAGHQIVIFPEGTRAPPGVVKELKPGVAALYLHCDAPVIPMALNSGVLWGKTRILKLPGEIVFRFLPAIPKGLDRHAFLAELHGQIATASAALSN